MTIASFNNPRVSSAINKINNLIPNIIYDTIGVDEITNNDFYVKLGSYGDQIMKIVSDTFWYVDDVRELYLWLDLGVDWMEKEPFINERGCYGFCKLLNQKDGGWTIIDKITTDIVGLNDKINEQS